MTNPQATTTVSKLDFALVEVSQSKTPIYSDKMKSLKINYLQGGNSCGLCFFANCTKKGRNPKVPPLNEEILFINCLLYNQFVCVG